MVMAKTWVLDTETKGTGAHVVPLEKVLRTSAPRPDLNVVEFERPTAPKPVPAPSPPARRRFKVVNVMTRETLAENADTRTTLELLGRIHSVVDIHVYVWSSERRRWRLLRLDEQRALWDLRTPALVSNAA